MCREGKESVHKPFLAVTNQHLQQTTGPGRKIPVTNTIQTQMLMSSYARASTS